jgi:hypothetical protein
MDMDERTDYYTDRASKVGDFCLGFFGVGLALVGVAVVVVPIAMSLASRHGEYVGGISSIVGFVLFLVGIVEAFRKGRRYIAIGMLSLILVPVLLVGTCALVIMGAGR